MEELEALDKNKWFNKTPNLDGIVVELGKLIVKDYWLMINNAIEDQSFFQHNYFWYQILDIIRTLEDRSNWRSIMLLNIVENIYVGAHQHRFQNIHMEVIHPNLEHPFY
jgi:hypothetical protein